MELTPMQYKGYVWTHNPRTYTIRYQRQVAVHKIPFGRYTMQDLGLTRRVMTGEGEFFGPKAYEEFKKLSSVFYEGGPGTLIHPVWPIWWSFPWLRNPERTTCGTPLPSGRPMRGTARVCVEGNPQQSPPGPGPISWPRGRPSGRWPGTWVSPRKSFWP